MNTDEGPIYIIAYLSDVNIALSQPVEDNNLAIPKKAVDPTDMNIISKNIVPGSDLANFLGIEASEEDESDEENQVTDINDNYKINPQLLGDPPISNNINTGNNYPYVDTSTDNTVDTGDDYSQKVKKLSDSDNIDIVVRDEYGALKYDSNNNENMNDDDKSSDKELDPSSDVNADKEDPSENQMKYETRPALLR